MNIRTQFKVIITVLLLLSMVNMGAAYYQGEKMSGDSNLINKTGAARGALQRLIKVELGVLVGMLDVSVADKIISDNNKLINGLNNGDKELGLHKPDPADKQFVNVAARVENCWIKMRTLIGQVRKGESNAVKIINKSENDYKLYDEMVHEATQISIKHSRQISNLMNIIFVFNLIIVGIIWVIIQKSIISPVENMAIQADRIVKGDFNVISKTTLRNEIGKLAEAISTIPETLNTVLTEFNSIQAHCEAGDLRYRGDSNRFDGSYKDLIKGSNHLVNALETSIKQVKKASLVVHSSSESMGASVTHMEASFVKISDDITNVAGTSEQMHTTLETISAAANNSSTNIQLVAESSEHMSNTVSEIAQSAEKALQVTSNAVKTVEDTKLKVNNLDTAAYEINKVTETIVEIAEQTKLLALNATIEAARAGEAGKGFAVVANEVKELAKQTSLATIDINEKIEAIQSSTKQTVSDINGISSIIAGVDDIVNNIASAVEEQSISTMDMSGNITQASDRLKDITNSISDTTNTSKDISQRIENIKNEMQEVEGSAKVVSINSTNLSVQGTELKSKIDYYSLSDEHNSKDGNQVA